MNPASESGDFQIEEREGRSEATAEKAERDARQDCDEVEVDAGGDVEEDVAVGLELAKPALIPATKHNNSYQGTLP